MKNKYFTTILLVSFFAIFSCNEEEFLREAPKDNIFAENLYVNYTGFYSGMSAIYSNMRQIILLGDGGGTTRQILWVYNTDVTGSRKTEEADLSSFSPGWVELLENWNWLYQIINSSNLIINRAEGDVDWEGITDEQDEINKKTIISEAKFARAWAYRLLIYAFGPVPLSIEEIDGSNYSNAWKRNSIDEIKSQMEKDLSYAVENLPIKTDDITRVNGAVASHFLGELYLSTGEFQQAIDVLKPVVESGTYQLVKSRFGKYVGNADKNLIIDIIRNPYPSNGNTESLFVMANGVNVPGAVETNLMQSWTGEYKNWNRIPKTTESYIRWGGWGSARYVMTPWSMMDENLYNLYDKIKDLKDPLNPHIIDKWLWHNDDGRDNFLFEMSDIRGQHTSIRKHWVYDWNGNGNVTDPPTYTLEQTLISNNVINMNQNNKGDTIYAFFKFDLDNLNKPINIYLYTPLYSRKWEVDATTTINFLSTKDYHIAFTFTRLAETYLLYAEAQLMNGNSPEAAIWINKVRNRSNASSISGGDVSIDFILDERARELITEEERRISLLRTGKFLERVRKYNTYSSGYIKDFHKLWPIPFAVIDENKDAVMEQNLGYGGTVTTDFTPSGYGDE
ncbi:MAG: RagB/SusD family nutrient uptake outer membrane protein [Bacteroidia bacterium]|nr:RagB/SusD family nutrient uptake outer membrane protein [Bacteroidia bacterium]